jgi:hypothetical protein
METVRYKSSPREGIYISYLHGRGVWGRLRLHETEPLGVIAAAMGQSVAIEVVMEGGLCVIEVDGISIDLP